MDGMALTRDQVEETALGILTRYGLGDLSMRRLARELDVQAGALYWHVKNKQELLVSVAARLLRGLGDGPEPTGQNTAREAIEALAVDLRRALLPVPDSAEVVQVARTLQPTALAPLNRLRSLLEVSGLSPTHADWARHLLLNHVLGSVAAAQEARRLAAVGSAPAAAEGAGDGDGTAGGGDDGAAGLMALGDDAFAWGLAAILDGLVRTTAAESRL
jgi:TetR/AcrR family transcriptional regulator, tetracycline repressor protein